MPAGSPLTQAHRIGADSCPLAAANPSPVDPVHNTARSAVCLSCRAHRNILTILSCLVHRDSSGAPLSPKWKRLLRDPVRAPDSVMPRGSLSFQASPGGLPVPVGCPVLSVWPWRAFLSFCTVLSV